MEEQRRNRKEHPVKALWKEEKVQATAVDAAVQLLIFRWNVRLANVLLTKRKDVTQRKSPLREEMPANAPTQNVEASLCNKQ